MPRIHTGMAGYTTEGDVMDHRRKREPKRYSPFEKVLFVNSNGRPVTFGETVRSLAGMLVMAVVLWLMFNLWYFAFAPIEVL